MPLKVINLYAAPGSGKSTTAAFIFAYLKNRGQNVELVTEYAKSMVYAKRGHEMPNQVYMLAKQFKRMDDIRRYEHVPLIVTDSPLLLGLLYSEGLPYFEELRALTFKLHNSFNNFNVLVRRVKPYNPSGRNQDEAGSDALIPKVKSLGVAFDYEIDGDEAGQAKLAQEIYESYIDKN